MGEARDRRRRGAAPQEVVAIDQVDRPRRVPCGRDDTIELLLVQGRLEPLLPAELAALVEGVAVGLIAERSLVLRLDEQLLPKVGHNRKSTRLNSSHVSISYAVFCLKK